MANTAEKEKRFLEKDKQVKAEIERLKNILIDLDVNEKKMQAAESLIENAAFMAVTLKDLRNKINKDGCVSKYQNGESQWGFKQSPETKTYNQMLKNHMSITKQLTNLLPEEQVKEAKDEFLKFVESRGD